MSIVIDPPIKVRDPRKLTAVLICRVNQSCRCKWQYGDETEHVKERIAWINELVIAEDLERTSLS